ncbi:hypothetical protein ON010_g12849 [Phytophthora cinnamomi]|nr:hypothetical protein ON010_g12849 [Phytophthora cinnamomi]
MAMATWMGSSVDQRPANVAGILNASVRESDQVAPALHLLEQNDVIISGCALVPLPADILRLRVIRKQVSPLRAAGHRLPLLLGGWEHFATQSYDPHLCAFAPAGRVSRVRFAAELSLFVAETRERGERIQELKMNCRSLNVLAVAVTLLVACCALALGGYTYPECAANGKGCCDFGTGSMRNRGYIIVQLDGPDMVVTCSNGNLRCSYENPNKKASYEAAENVTCPGKDSVRCCFPAITVVVLIVALAVTDFSSMMESRSEITYLDGVKAKTTSTANDETGAGTVKAADVSD